MYFIGILLDYVEILGTAIDGQAVATVQARNGFPA
jgi:hypothetical protein